MYMRSFVALGLATSIVVSPAVLAQEAPAPQKTATAEPPLETPQPSATAVPEPTPQDPLGVALQQRLTGPTPALAKEDLEALAAFYAKRIYEPIWVGPAGLTPKAEAAVAEIKKADDWGLNASDFTLPGPLASDAAPSALAEAETTLSAAVLKYARYARGGRITNPAQDLSSYLDRTPQLLGPQDVLAQLATSTEPDAALRSFHPQHPQFEKLRQALLKLRKDAAENEIVRIPDGPLLKPGMSHPDIALLRKRLEVAPPAPTADGKPVDATFFDDALKDALLAFQKAKGLNPDALVGRGTRSVLNDVEVLSPDKLVANMEAWRWMPADMGDLYVWVNIPEFTLRIVKGGSVIHTERAITGLVGKQTPVFSENMKNIIFQPRWNVPNSIKVNELYPSLARGGEYFERQGLRLTQNGRRIDPDDVDWDETDIRRFDVYQPPGPHNALGVVKFAFPNKHLVYMHDTPTKHLFENATRAYSHGCMRVRNPVRMAEILLAEDKGWDAAKVDDLVAHGPEDNAIAIERAIGVHVTYFTAWVDDNGETQMASDIYGHEKRITLALAGKWNQIAKGPNHLAPVQLKTVDDGWSFFGSSGGSGKKKPKTVGDYVQSILGGGF
ncbi:MAG TPA: L,D-transpeptidase family protein [Hyphomicrobium sp.]